MQRLLRHCTALFGLLAATGWSAESPGSLPAPGAPAVANLKAHVDPGTGRMLPHPAAPLGTNSAPMIAAPGNHRLAETPVTARGGGFRVDLDGRFRCATVAYIGPDGKITTRCTSPGHEHPGGDTAPTPASRSTR